MADNFRLLQDDPNRVFYISKAGLAGDNGLAYRGSRLNPLPGVAEFLAATPGGSVGVVGTGQYAWGTTFANGSFGTINHELVADGTVRIFGDGRTRFAPFVNASARLTGLTFEQFGGFNFRYYVYSNPITYSQCVFKVLPEFADQPNASADGLVAFDDCVFVNVHFARAGESTFTRCLFFNCSFDNPTYAARYCYFDATTRGAVLDGPRQGEQPSAWGNNVDPRADLAQGYGLRLNAGTPGYASPGGLSADPLFNAPADDDFSVRAGSPHLAAGIGPRHLRQAATYRVQAPAAGQLAEAANTSFAPVGGGAAVGLLGTSGPVEGTQAGALAMRPAAEASGPVRLRTDRIRHSPGLPRELSYMQALGATNFNASYPALESQLNPNAPEVFNNNVLAASQYAAGEAGRNPARLSYRLRWSTLPSPRLDHPEDWATGTELVECEWNARPLYNPATNVGNGRPEFVAAEGRPIICTWYQLEVSLTNTYFR
jgi:hypothetical protein